MKLKRHKETAKEKSLRRKIIQISSGKRRKVANAAKKVRKILTNKTSVTEMTYKDALRMLGPDAKTFYQVL